MSLERGFDGSLTVITRGLDVVLRHQRPTLYVLLRDHRADGWLYVLIPKGFFPQQDTGLILGQTDAPQDIGYPEMKRRLHLLTDVRRTRPGRWPATTRVVGAGNSAEVFASLLPGDRAQGRRQRRSDHPAYARQIAKVPGATLFLQSRQDITGRRPA